MNSSAIKNKVCPCCGQEVLTPNEFTGLVVPTAYRLLLFKLFRVMPNTVPHEMLGQKSTVWVAVSRLNSALSDYGSAYKIEVDHGQGYYLNRKVRRQ